MNQTPNKVPDFSRFAVRNSRLDRSNTLNDDYRNKLEKQPKISVAPSSSAKKKFIKNFEVHKRRLFEKFKNTSLLENMQIAKPPLKN